MVGGLTISALQDHCICGVRRLYPCVPRPGRSDGLGAFGLRDRAEWLRLGQRRPVRGYPSDRSPVTVV